MHCCRFSAEDDAGSASMREMIKMLAESQAEVKRLQVRGYMRVFEFSASSCYDVHHDFTSRRACPRPRLSEAR
jgi:hypothetical protein